jgi:hypothetical protein
MNWIHLHLILNHVPVLAPPLLLLVLFWAWHRGQSETIRFLLGLLVLVSLFALFVKFTGEWAAGDLARFPHLAAPGINVHEKAADQATTAIFFLGVTSAWLWRQARYRRPLGKGAGLLLFLLGLVTFGMMARTANTGGLMRHPEIAPSTAKAR